MAHITEFTIEGLVGRKKPYTKKLNRDVNIFFGINGSGKTTLLKILSSAMARDASLLTNAYFKRAEVKIYSVDYDTVFTYSIEMPRKKTVNSKEYLLPNIDSIESYFIDRESTGLEWKVDKDLTVQNNRWRHTFLPTARLYIGSKLHPSIQTDPRELEAKFVSGVQSIWAGYHTDLLRTVRTAQEKGLGSILRQVLSPKESEDRALEPNLEEAYARAMSFLSRQVPSKKPILSKQKFMDRYNSDPLLRYVVDDIESVEKQIEEATLPKTKLHEILNKMFANKNVDLTDKIEISTQEGSRINLGELSSGEKHLLQIMVATAGVNESTIFIDEPELSMHIDWQKDLIASMREVNPSAQLVLATHSPEIMADIEDKNIFRV